MLSPLFSEVQLSAFLLTLGSKYIIIILFFQDCYYRITLSKSIFCHFFFYLQKITAVAVLTSVAAIAAPVMAEGLLLPY